MCWCIGKSYCSRKCLKKLMKKLPRSNLNPGKLEFWNAGIVELWNPQRKVECQVAKLFRASPLVPCSLSSG